MESYLYRIGDAGSVTGVGGRARARCLNPGTSSGCLDPHYTVQISSGLASQAFTFDFHGLANKVYCMVSDIALQLNVRMFGISQASKVIERKADLGDDCFVGTWMDAIGFIHANKNGARDNLTIELDHNKARNGAFPFRVAYNKEDLTEAMVSQEGAKWTSQDGGVALACSPDHASILSVDIKGVLSMDISAETEQEIIVDLPIYFVNFQLKNIATTPAVHGFLGQMYAPGAIKERLAMGTLEGFRHREYVEGTDEYEISELTATGCSFSRFGKAYTNASDLQSGTFSGLAMNRRLLKHVPSVNMEKPGSGSLPAGCHLANKKRLGAISISCATNER
ncbi:hypothetical protein KFL_007180040 [Klebsormidium nitens]|uniref:Uncharacterized protein n=1 Tax=Klebsormidium nitens TaxID=105231 RepID=A0A1Y1IJZ2_KLENI|nr:hypothetical protein KFL_007180040 [Klebsormidium nitens]|eukprot:GAQ91043.1 hypothetical protein KFL_007180040 [Klebsormidium nitens]